MANNFSATTLHPAGCAFGDDNSVTKHSMMKGPRDSNICRTTKATKVNFAKTHRRNG